MVAMIATARFPGNCNLTLRLSATHKTIQVLRGNEWATYVNVNVRVNIDVPERCVTLTVICFWVVLAFCGRTELLWQIVTEKDLLQV